MMKRLRTEAMLAGVLLCFGVLALPVAIYFVGARLVGDYRPGAGPMDLAEDVWSALAAGEIGAVLLVVAPYAVVQLGRLTARLWRGGPTVSRVTDPQA